MASPSAAMLNEWSGHRDFVAVIQSMAQEIVALKAQVATLLLAKKQTQRKDITELKSFEKVPKFDGEVKAFTDFEFKLHRFITPMTEFEEYLNLAKDRDTEPVLADVQQKHRDELVKNDKLDISWYDSQLHIALALVCVGDALTTVRQVRDQGGCRGAKAWHQLTREVAGKTGTKLLKASDKAHNLKAITHDKEARGLLNH